MFAAAATGAAALWLVIPEARADQKPPAQTPEVHLLNRLLDLEYATVAAYEAGIPLLDPDAAMAAQQFLRHELSHTGELAGLVKKAGGNAVRPRLGYKLGHPRNASETLAVLQRFESMQLAAYSHAMAALSDTKTRAALAAVMANDAQHLTILRQQRGLDPAPTAFVAG